MNAATVIKSEVSHKQFIAAGRTAGVVVLSQGQRKLAAIMFTDVVGYTLLGQRNESLSIAIAHAQKTLIRPVLNRHKGREVKTLGDAFLVEFPNALDAVRCAYDIQRSTREFNISLPEDRRVHLRIGLHLGDVTKSRGDIEGDAVNIASRIESLAEDGGVCLTRQVYDHVHNKFELPLRSLGTKSLKNVVEPVEVYRMEFPWEKAQNRRPELDATRIAVLPFANMSPDPGDEYFADGLTEELIATISKIREVSVVSRTSVMQYRKNPKPIRDVAEELQAGTILEGSVRKSGNKVRVTIQLVDAARDKHEWSESYDRSMEDIFAIQSDISQNVAEVLKIQLFVNDKNRLEKVPTQNLDAFTLYLKGRRELNARTQRGFHEAIRLFEEATGLDPKYAAPYAGLADSYNLLEGWLFMSPQLAFPKSFAYALKALELEDGLADAHASMAMCLEHMKRDWKGAEREFRRAIDLNPSYVPAHDWYAFTLLQYERRWDEAIRESKEAARLDPLSQIIARHEATILFWAGRREEAMLQFRRALSLKPDNAFARSEFGIYLVYSSSIEEGTAEIEEALKFPSDNIWPKARLAMAYAAANRKTEAEKILRELKEISKERYIPGTIFAIVCAALGEKDLAFDWLSQAVRDRTSTLFVLNEAVFDKHRSDPRLHEILGMMGLS